MQNGTYKGLAPTDESAHGRGELVITIDDEVIRSEFATGWEVEHTSTPRSELRQLSDSEIEALLAVETATPEEVAEAVDAMIVHVIGGATGVTFIEAKEIPEDTPKGTPHVIVLRLFSDEIDGIFGPSFLFTPTQVEDGEFELMVGEMEHDIDLPGSLPRVANGGRPTTQ